MVTVWIMFGVIVLAATAITITAVCTRARRKTAASRHAALQGIARDVPPGSKLTHFESGAQTWVDFAPTNEVSHNRGRR